MGYWVDLRMKKIILNIFIFKTVSLIIAQNWEQSFIAGGFDADGSFMGGSEVLHLVDHKIKTGLFYQFC